jgi:hypothetical protein
MLQLVNGAYMTREQITAETKTRCAKLASMFEAIANTPEKAFGDVNAVLVQLTICETELESVQTIIRRWL